VTIDANSVFGDVELLVPEGVAVEIRSRRFASVAARLHERLLRLLTPFRLDPP
jgi:hypothetical protein